MRLSPTLSFQRRRAEETISSFSRGPEQLVVPSDSAGRKKWFFFFWICNIHRWDERESINRQVLPQAPPTPNFKWCHLLLESSICSWKGLFLNNETLIKLRHGQTPRTWPTIKQAKRAIKVHAPLFLPPQSGWTAGLDRESNLTTPSSQCCHGANLDWFN